jgi:endonuclease YncB( thermonuclease family)
VIDNYVRKATPIRVIDGDTFEMRIDLGYGVEGRFRIRLRGFDAAELSSDEGPHARKWAEELLTQAMAITVHSAKDTRSFERWVADIYLDGQHMATRLQTRLKTLRAIKRQS